jgi:hypothetical protein
MNLLAPFYWRIALCVSSPPAWTRGTDVANWSLFEVFEVANTLETRPHERHEMTCSQRLSRVQEITTSQRRNFSTSLQRDAWEGIATGYYTGTCFYRLKLFVNPSSANTHKIPIPDNRNMTVLHCLLTGPLNRLLNRFWIWKRFWESMAIGYNTSTGFYRPKLFVNPSRANTHKVAIPW